jgi:sulfatase maturation enzyme AslB (radical SAM superfamily)
MEAREVELMFLGGEPLLEWPKLRRAVQYAEKNVPPGKQLKYGVSTNGYLITEDVAAFLDRHEFQIQLSFDGIPKAQNYRRRGTFAAIDRLLDRLRQEHADLFEHRLKACITLIPPAIPYLESSIKYLVGKGVREISISPSLTPFPGWTDDCRAQLDDQLSRVWDISLAHFKRTGEVPFLLFKKMKKEERRQRQVRRMCAVMSGKELLIDVDGQVHGCALFADCYQEFPSDFLRKRVDALRMGDFRDPGFWKRYAVFPEAVRKAEMFHHKEKKYSSYRKCGECEYLDSCAVCPVSIGYDPKNTDPHRVPDFLCAFNMVALRYRERFPNMPDPIERLNLLLRGTSRKARSAQG